jgi:hypothetical protein
VGRACSIHGSKETNKIFLENPEGKKLLRRPMLRRRKINLTTKLSDGLWNEFACLTTDRQRTLKEVVMSPRGP